MLSIDPAKHCKMKHLYSIILFVFVLSACSHRNKDNDVVCPKLGVIIDSFISHHSADSYFVILSKIDDMEVLNISTALGYNSKYIDGYFFRKGKLITYCIFYKDWNNIIKINNTNKFEDTIPKYSDMANVLCNFEPIGITYRIMSKDSFKIMTQRDFTSVKKQYMASGNNGINSKPLNKAINTYINNHKSELYQLRFNELNGQKYVSIRGSQTFDQNKTDGFIYRNNHVIILYSIGKVIKMGILNSKDIITMTDTLPYKNVVMEGWDMPYPQKYKILSKDSIVDVTDDEQLFGI